MRPAQFVSHGGRGDRHRFAPGEKCEEVEPVAVLKQRALHLLWSPGGKQQLCWENAKRLSSARRSRWPRSAPDSQAASVYGSFNLWPCRLHAFWEWLFADGDMLLHPPCPRQLGGQTAADSRGRPQPLKWCSPGEIIGKQWGHVWWVHTLQIYLGAVVSEQQQSHSQTLYSELSFISLPLFSAEAWYAALIMTALRKFSPTLAEDIIHSTLESTWSVFPCTQNKYKLNTCDKEGRQVTAKKRVY